MKKMKKKKRKEKKKGIDFILFLSYTFFVSGFSQPERHSNCFS